MGRVAESYDHGTLGPVFAVPVEQAEKVIPSKLLRADWVAYAEGEAIGGIVDLRADESGAPSAWPAAGPVFDAFDAHGVYIASVCSLRGALALVAEALAAERRSEALR